MLIRPPKGLANATNRKSCVTKTSPSASPSGLVAETAPMRLAAGQASAASAAAEQRGIVKVSLYANSGGNATDIWLIVPPPLGCVTSAVMAGIAPGAATDRAMATVGANGTGACYGAAAF